MTRSPAWTVSETWKNYATSLHISDFAIGTKMLASILSQCLHLVHITVALQNYDITSLAAETATPGVIRVEHLETLDIKTTTEPQPILDLLECPKLDKFRLAWDRCGGQSMPHQIRNIFPREDELIEYWIAEHIFGI
ncbi:hypothetical protein DXG03_005666 [Asterophora parasitica]|uniref:Uncharacterized protein n=1 Tax=Asterophora parasitica TaxID=117018 RepID=A0A9P7KAV7_9AGAR|nr:hypothetical protein DXG03_005666 [Asterophora parasitica]